MKPPNPTHPLRNTLKQLALAAATSFGASPANATPVTTGLALHLDAGDSSTMTLAGSTVTEWRDKNGSAAKMTLQAGDPTLEPTGIGGMPTVRFNTLSRMNDGVSHAAPVTLFYVSRQTGGANHRVLGATGNNWLLGYWNGKKGSAYFNGDVLLNGNGTPDTAPHLYAATIRGSGQNSTVWAEGVQIASNTGGTAGPNNLQLNGYQGGSELSNCDISEVLVYHRILDANELMAVGGYLTAKYGLTTSYPTGLTVTLDSPANGSNYLVGATIPATATVFAGTAPSTVDFLLDNGGGFVSQGTDSEAPYARDVTGLAIGSYSIKASVTDSTPATADSAVRTFTVSNAGPGNLAAVSGNQLVNVSWNQVLGATGYTVLRSSPDNSSYAVIATGLTGLTYQDTGLTNGIPYYYVVRATVGSTVSDPSNEASATPVAVDNSKATVVASTPFVWADGVATSTITVTLKNGGNAPVPGLTVTLASSRTSEDTVSAASGLSDGNGLVTFTVKSSVVGTSAYTATVSEIPLTLSQTATVGFVDPSTPRLINVNFTGGTAENASTLSGPGGGLGTIWNQFTGPNAPGTLVYSTGVATPVTITSNFGLPVTFDSPVVARPLLRGSMTDFGKGRDNIMVTISGLKTGGVYKIWMVTLRNQGYGADGTEQYVGWWSTTNTTSSPGNQLVNAVSPTINTSTFVAGYNYVLFENVVANGSGQIVFTGVAGELLNGSDNNHRLGLNGLQIQEADPVMAGPVNDTMSTVAAAPSAVVANGVSTSTVKVTLRDANGVRVPNKEVTLTNTGGLAPPPARITNAQGEADFPVSSSTVGTVVFTATVVADNLTLTDTVRVEFTDPHAPVAFNVNFHAGSPATGLIGVVGAPGETWNQGTTSAGNLIDSTGAVASSVSVTGLPGDGYTVNAALNVFDDNRNFFSKAQDTTLSITGLVPDTAYDLYIYSLSHNAGSWGNLTDTERAAGNFVTPNTVLLNSASQFLDNGLPGVNGSAFVANGNYVVFQSILSDSLGNISVLADAHDGLDNNPATSDGDCRLHLSGLQIRPATGMSLDYIAWRDARYPGLGLPHEDDDADGLNNDTERVFGMDPTDPASASPYWAAIDPATGTLGYTRRIRSLANMNHKVWYSTNLVQWVEDNSAFQTVASVSNDVEFMRVAIHPLLLSKPRLYLRIEASAVSALDAEPSLVNLWGADNSITLLFSEPMNPLSAATAANYQVLQEGGGTIPIVGLTLSSDGGRATLALASPLGNNTRYTVSIGGVTSATGQALGTGVSRPFKTWDNNPNGIKVFILAGQSNMVGYGNVETGNSGAGTVGSLRYLAVNDASFPDYDYASLLANPSQPVTSAFRTRSDVKVWWRDGGPNLGGTVRKGDLGPPFKGADNGRIGPEFAFGHVIGDFYPTNNVLLVKAAWGGRSLVKDFRPPSAVAARGGRVGDFFSAMIDYTSDVLSNLDTEFPEWSGQGYQIVGFGWHQGFNDLIDATASEEYKNNLPDLIQDVREVFGKPNLPFVIASTGMDAGPVEPPPYAGYRALEKAQLWVAGVPRPANVLSTDARPFWRVAAVSPANEGYHWNHNAESYFLIGKSLGDSMVDLLTP